MTRYHEVVEEAVIDNGHLVTTIRLYPARGHYLYFDYDNMRWIHRRQPDQE